MVPIDVTRLTIDLHVSFGVGESDVGEQIERVTSLITQEAREARPVFSDKQICEAARVCLSIVLTSTQSLFISCLFQVSRANDKKNFLSHETGNIFFFKKVVYLPPRSHQQLINETFFFYYLGMSSRHDTTSPECSAESPAFLSPSSNLLYDQHSSEEELEVIMTKPLDTLVEMSYSNENMDQNQKIKINDDERSPKRCSSSTFLEKRKRSLAHNSDDEVSCHAYYDVAFAMT